MTTRPPVDEGCVVVLAPASVDELGVTLATEVDGVVVGGARVATVTPEVGVVLDFVDDVLLQPSRASAATPLSMNGVWRRVMGQQ